MLVLGSCGQVLFSNLESIHVTAAKIIFHFDWRKEWNTLEIVYEKLLLILAQEAYYYFSPCPMNCIFKKMRVQWL